MADQSGRASDESWRQRLIESELSRQIPLRILVAEDNDLNRELIIRMLRRLGYHADVAENGREALAALRRQSYDMILMDVQMPEMDGLQATRAIREGQAGEQQPWIIAVTAGAVGSDREACLSAGMNDFLLKPIEQKMLTLALTRAQTEALAGPPAEPGTASPTEILDAATLHNLKGTLGAQAEKILPGLIATFLQSNDRNQASARTALAAGDIQGLRRSMHTLKSNANTFGARRLAALCRNLEQQSARGELGEAETLLKQIAIESARLHEALSKQASSE